MRLIKISDKPIALKLTMILMKNWIVIGFVTLAIIISSSKLIAKTSDPEKPTTLQVQKIIHENDLNLVYLNDNSFQKLGIEIALIKRETMNKPKTYGGEIVLPPGNKVNISAPISGRLISINTASLKPGEPLKAGQLLYRIQPTLSADARANLVSGLAEAESLVKTAQSQVDAAEMTLVRAKKLLDNLVGSQRNVDEANASYQIAMRNFEAANAKKHALNQVVNSGAISPIEIRSPQTGIISNIFAVSNQFISAGNPIIEISALSSLWVRVPLPLGDLNEVDPHAMATVSQLSNTINTPSLLAKPINAPPTADPLTSSVHLYYAIQNQQSTLSPAQRVSVTLNTFYKSINVIAIPRSAIVIDIHGGSWVYLEKSKNTFERKRVFVDHVSGNHAIISRGPTEGTRVVVNGALELFGVETGFTH